MSKGRLRRGLLCAVLAACASAIVGVSSAAAAPPTTTAITSPSSPFLYQYNDNASSPATVTISGTSNGTSGTVDVRCYYDYNGGYTSGYTTIASGVAVNADGTWSTGPISPDGDGYPCYLRAVPTGYTTNAGLSAFAPVYSELDYTELYPTSGGSYPGGPFYDYYYSGAGSSATSWFDSVGDTGIYSMYPMMPGSTAFAEYPTWYYGGALYSNDDAGSRSEIVVDGKSSYDSYEAESAFSGADTESGFPALTSSYSKTGPGTETINESEPLVSCPNGAWPATSSNCTSWQSDGVSFNRAISQTDNGALIKVTDTYTSTDGAAHSIDAEYYNQSDEYDADTTWNIPGTGGYSYYATGDQLEFPAKSNGAIYITSPDYPDGNTYSGPGSLIYTSQPNYIRFGDYYYMELDYQRSVPAGGSVSITQYYATAYDQAALNGVTNSVLDSLNKPTVSITSPSPNSFTTANSVLVSGTASANEGLSVSVNGENVPVNSNGTWAATIALRSGKNPVVATASDGSGNTAQASETIYSGPTANFCIVPNVSRMSLAKAKKALVRAHCGVGKVRHAHSKIKKGKVIRAARSPHVVLSYDTKVGLTVSSGRSKKKHNVRVPVPGARPRNRS